MNFHAEQIHFQPQYLNKLSATDINYQHSATRERHQCTRPAVGLTPWARAAARPIALTDVGVLQQATDASLPLQLLMV